MTVWLIELRFVDDRKSFRWVTKAKDARAAMRKAFTGEDVLKVREVRVERMSDILEALLACVD